MVNVWIPDGSVNQGPSTGQETYSFRVVIPNLAAGSLLAASLGQVRVSFISCVTAITTTVANASIGVSTGTAASTTATPVELKFSGAGAGSGGGGGSNQSGFSIAPSGTPTTIVSDWANLSWTTSDALVVVMDMFSTGGNMMTSIESAGHAHVWYNGPTVASYNVASAPASPWTDNGVGNRIITLIETQAGAAAPILMGAICL